MGKVKVAAKNWVVEIEVVDNGTASWVPIGNISNVSPSGSKTRDDTTDNDSGSTAEHLPFHNERSLNVEGFVAIDEDTGELDPGQAALFAAAEDTGYQGLHRFRLTSPSGRTKIARFSVDLSNDEGGTTQQAARWSATLTQSGDPEPEDE